MHFQVSLSFSLNVTIEVGSNAFSKTIPEDMSSGDCESLFRTVPKNGVVA